MRGPDDAWWKANGTEYGVAGTQEVSDTTRDPLEIVEDLGFVADSLTIGHGPPEGRNFYRVTANSTGASDTAQALLKADHGYWAAQLYEPYVPEKTAFAIKYHQALRFFADPAYGYEYPDLYRRLFGEDYVPLPHIRADYEMLKKHPWYEAPRLVTVNDFYSFDPKAKISIDPFREIIGRHFKQPKEGLGNDNSPVAHMWRSIIWPGRPL